MSAAPGPGKAAGAALAVSSRSHFAHGARDRARELRERLAERAGGRRAVASGDAAHEMRVARELGAARAQPPDGPVARDDRLGARLELAAREGDLDLHVGPLGLVPRMQRERADAE